jgi:hypothetical protein
MTVARPILLLGPDPSHVADILGEHHCGWRVAHGDVVGAERIMRQILDTPPQDLREMGQRARRAVQEHFSMHRLRADFCDLLINGN